MMNYHNWIAVVNQHEAVSDDKKEVGDDHRTIKGQTNADKHFAEIIGRNKSFHYIKDSLEGGSRQRLMGNWALVGLFS